MTSRMRYTAAVIYAINGLVSMILGGLYLFRETFMPYHAAALATDWPALDQATQTLILALMDVAGAGWAVTGFLVLLLVLFPFRAGERWARWAIPAALVLLYVPILMATLTVLADTAGNPPWYGNVVALVTTAVGLMLDRPWKTANSRGSDEP